MANELLRYIPKVDQLLELLEKQPLARECAQSQRTQAVRTVLEQLRAQILSDTVTEIPTLDALAQQVLGQLQQAQQLSLRGVINATGVILHTNLGRACLSTRATQAVYDVAAGYSTLEYDCENGTRGSRHSHIDQYLTRLTGAEAAMAVNNNAAAVLLILSAMAAGGEVITSRGELVEIGGSFRIPEIMESCGCSLREVGSTNKTHLYDYQRAVNEHTRALLKVHTSNYRIVGFTEAVPLEQLVALGEEKHLPVIEDLGSGALVRLEQFGLSGEPTVQDSVRAGVDVVCFSGDKLLGGPQAGLIVGKKKYIDLLKHHPLARAMRVDKMTLAALGATLRSYVSDAAVQEIPTLQMLAATPSQLREKAQKLCDLVLKAGFSAQVIRGESQVGGGSVPTQLIETMQVCVSPKQVKVEQMDARLRHRPRPVVARIAHGQLLLDARTVFESDFDEVVKALTEAIS